MAAAIAAAIAYRPDGLPGQPAPADSNRPFCWHRTPSAAVSRPGSASVATGTAAGFAAGSVVPVLGHGVGTVTGAISGGRRAQTVKGAGPRLRTAVREAGTTPSRRCAEAPIIAVRHAYPPTGPPEPTEPADLLAEHGLRAARAHLAAASATICR